MHTLTCTLVAAAFAISVLSAHAASITITNPSFEADFAADGTFPLLTPSGWSPYDPNAILNGGSNSVGVVNPTGTTFFSGPVPDGRNAALVFLDGPGTGAAGLFQTLGALLQPDTEYTLSVGIGNIASGTGLPPFNVFGFFNLAGFPGYRVELLAGGQVIAMDNNTLAGTIADGQFGLSTVQATIGAAHPLLGQPLGIRLVNLHIPGTPAAHGIEVDFDNVALTAVPVPEPATYAFFLTGLAVLCAWRRMWRQCG